jgi:hypothetical protein
MPDVDQLSRVISEATAPAFVLTAVAGFVSVLRAQLISVVERIRSLNESPTPTIPVPTSNRTFRDCGGEPPS